jgi:hypothetical protein
MNQFTARKLGEVKAFAVVGVDIIKRSREALERSLATAEVERVLQTIDKQKEVLEIIIYDSKEKDLINTKAEGTIAKIESMSGVYMKKEEDWQDPAEVLEWLGFFIGGAIVHFYLAAAAGRGSGLVEISAFAEEAAEFYEDFLEDVSSAIGRLAEKRAEND